MTTAPLPSIYDNNHFAIRSGALAASLEHALEALRAAQEALSRSRDEYTKQRVRRAIDHGDAMIAEIKRVSDEFEVERLRRKAEREERSRQGAPA